MPPKNLIKLNRLHEKLNLDSHGDAVRVVSGLESNENQEKKSLYKVSDAFSEKKSRHPESTRRISRRLSSLKSPMTRQQIEDDIEDPLLNSDATVSTQNDILFHSVTNSTVSEVINDTLSLSDDKGFDLIESKNAHHSNEGDEPEIHYRNERPSYRDLIRKDVSPETRRIINLKEIEDHFRTFKNHLKSKISNGKNGRIKFSSGISKEIKESGLNETYASDSSSHIGNSSKKINTKDRKAKFLEPFSRFIGNNLPKQSFRVPKDAMERSPDIGSSKSGKNGILQKNAFSRNEILHYRPWRRRNDRHSGSEVSESKKDDFKRPPHHFNDGLSLNSKPVATIKPSETSSHSLQVSQDLFRSESIGSINKDASWPNEKSSSIQKPPTELEESRHGEKLQMKVEILQSQVNTLEVRIGELACTIDSLSLENAKYQKSVSSKELELERLVAEIGLLSDEKMQGLLIGAERRFESRLEDAILKLEKKDVQSEIRDVNSVDVLKNNSIPIPGNPKRQYSNPSNSISDHAISWFILGLQTILLPLSYLYSICSKEILSQPNRYILQENSKRKFARQRFENRKKGRK